MDQKVHDFIDKKIKTESHLEEFFTREVKKAGGWAVKFNPLGTRGLPDRIVFYHSFTWLVELKTEKGVVQPVQKNVHELFATHGFKVRIVRNKKQVADFIQDMLNMEL